MSMGWSLLVAQIVDLSVIIIMCDVRSELSTMEKYKTDVIVLQTIDNACKLVATLEKQGTG